ncbi:MAG: tRNA pseudouridine(38-40) synthase TruA [Bacteroidetes bacterium]|nr:tRNA pseudouridine(38-40) synthase TruA [Bacteroidota bacterium]
MTHRYAFKVEYNGLQFNGWQLQPPSKAKKTVQGTLESTIRIIEPQFKGHISGAGRTDTGVHASGQYFHLDLDHKIDLFVWMHKINGILDQEPVTLLKGYEVHPDFHARFSASHRTYEYTLNSLPSPLNRHQEWFYPWNINFNLLQEYAKVILTQTDFTSFCRSRDESDTKDCRIMTSEWAQIGSRYRFTIRANRFLYGMVRALVGTQLQAMRENQSAEQFAKIFDELKRTSAGPSAKAHGLNLVEVAYPEHLFLM